MGDIHHFDDLPHLQDIHTEFFFADVETHQMVTIRGNLSGSVVIICP